MTAPAAQAFARFARNARTTISVPALGVQRCTLRNDYWQESPDFGMLNPYREPLTTLHRRHCATTDMATTRRSPVKRKKPPRTGPPEGFGRVSGQPPGWEEMWGEHHPKPGDRAPNSNAIDFTPHVEREQRRAWEASHAAWLNANGLTWTPDELRAWWDSPDRDRLPMAASDLSYSAAKRAALARLRLPAGQHKAEAQRHEADTARLNAAITDKDAEIRELKATATAARKQALAPDTESSPELRHHEQTVAQQADVIRDLNSDNQRLRERADRTKEGSTDSKTRTSACASGSPPAGGTRIMPGTPSGP